MFPSKLLSKIKTLRKSAFGLLFCVGSNTLTAQATLDSSPFEWSTDEHRRILSFGPWPGPSQALDAPERKKINPLAGNPKAIALGERLFKDPRLSATGFVSCETCHVAKLGFTDGLAKAKGVAEGRRNTQGLFDLAEQRWFGWDGGTDSLWAASLRPLLDPTEMGHTDLASASKALANLLKTDRTYRGLVGSLVDPRKTNEAYLVAAAMSLAAWMETIESDRTSFDRYRDALSQAFSESTITTTPKSPPPARAEVLKRTGFTEDAERGLKIFISKGNCWVCHGGPRFTHGEFHDIGRPFMFASKQTGRAPEVDPGRYTGIQRLKKDRFNLLGPWSPDPKSARAELTEQTLLQHRNWGEWKIPSLRNLKQTAPYMHDGSLTSLQEVVLHYSELNEERLHADGEALLKPLKLSAREIKDLVAFLESLSP
jgi:cytochrome c peroxidase